MQVVEDSRVKRGVEQEQTSGHGEKGGNRNFSASLFPNEKDNGENH